MSENTFWNIIGLIVTILLSIWGSCEAYNYYSDERREEFESSASFIGGKQDAALKYYNEFRKAKTIEEKNGIIQVVKMEFLSFDESKLVGIPLQNFIYDCKYQSEVLLEQK